jgi:hypothetical protein
MSAVLTIPFPSTAVADYTITQLTDNLFDDQVPRINNKGDVVWQGHDGNDYEIYLYKGSLPPEQITTNNMDDWEQQVNDNGQVVWHDANYDLFLYDGSFATQIPSPASDNEKPQINNNGDVTWMGYNGGWVIYLYNGNNTPQITPIGNIGDAPQINNTGCLVWQGLVRSDTDIFLYDIPSKITTPLSSSLPDWGYYDPQINDNGQVVFSGGEWNDNNIFLYDGSITSYLYWSQQLATNK